MDLFGFGMLGNYEQRKVARFEIPDKRLVIDTAAVTDSDEPYETAVSCPKYNNGQWVIVQMYSTKQDAVRGHDEWVKKMTSDPLPEHLEDVSTSEIKKLLL